MPTAPPGMSITEAQRVLQMQDRELQGVPRGRARVRQDRPRRLADRSGAALDGRDGRHAEARVRVAARRDATRGSCRRWTRSSATPACPTPGGCRSRRATRCSRRACARSSASRSTGPTSRRSSAPRSTSSARSPAVPGTRSAFAERLDRRLLSRHRRRPRRGRAPRAARARRLGGGRVGARRHERRADHRGPRALPDRGPLRARLPRRPRRARAHARARTRPARRCRSSQVATIHFAMGPDMVRSEAGQLVGLRVRRRRGPPDRRLRRATRSAWSPSRSQLPAGVRLEWAGQFEACERARDRLYVVVPLTLLLVALLLYFNTGSAVETAIVLLAVPFSLVGAVWLLWAARLQPVDRGVGRHHRARRARRGDGRRDAALPDARASRARGGGTHAQPGRPRRSDRRGRRAAHPARRR